MKVSIFILFIFLAACATSPKYDGNSKVEDIKLLIKTSGDLDHMYQTVIAGYTQSEDEALMSEPWKSKVEQFVFKKVYEDTELLDKLVALYDRHYSHDEIIEIRRFQESRVGKKVRDTKPLIFVGAYKIGESWGQTLAEELENELRKELQITAKDK